MTTTFWKRTRCGVLFLVSGALIAIACSGGDTPYEPLRKNTPLATMVGGTVRDAGGTRIADAVVTLETADNGVPATAKWMLDHPDASSDQVPGRRVTMTNDSGRYAFSDVKSGDYILDVQANDHLAGSQTLNVPAEALTDTIIVNVTLTPTGEFAGNAFLEGASTHPNTVVYVQGTSYVSITSPDGSYTISGVPTGSYTVRATHADYVDETRSGTISTAGQTVTLSDMTLKMDLNIAPVAQVTVASKLCALDPVPLSGAASSDVDGTIVQYAWDFEDDGSVDFTSSTPATTHVYSSGTHHVKLRVTDDAGGYALAVATFSTVNADSVFVSPTGSNSNPGTRSLPKQTIGAGITAAVANILGSCPSVVIVAGDYTESPVLAAGIQILGGFNSTTWTRAANSYSVVNVQNTPALANNISSATTTISGFDFRAANGQSGTPTQRNSIAMRVISSSTLAFVDCRFQAGNGAAAPSGAAGSAGANGSAGVTNSGQSGGAGGAGGSPGGLAGGHGGAGGSGGAEPGGGGCGTAGLPGANGCCNAGGPLDGLAGGSGCLGTHGANGAAQSSYGSAGTDWAPLAGLAGLSGTGGGGGGGGGNGGWMLRCGNPTCPLDQPGAGGAGGGGGGGYASGGSAGGGGGASFAVYLYDSSPSFVECRFTTGVGGAGGVGGNGGSRGAGGAGAIHTFVTELASGGNGGNGGPGGHGGAGSGGPGGLSFGVYRAGSSTPVLTTATYSIGSGGAGGAGGVRPDAVAAPAGPNGTSGNVGP